jgi:hypothetical protein
MKDVEFIWTDSFQFDFTELKKILATTPILRGPNWDFTFHISLDDLDTAIGVVLDVGPWLWKKAKIKEER